MILQVSKLKTGENHFHYPTKEGAELAPLVTWAREQGYEVRDEMELDVRLTRLEPEYYLKGRLEFTVELPCSRCAETASVKIDHPFELGLVHSAGKPAVPQETVGTNEEIDALDLNYFSGPELDLRPIVEEQFHLSLPFQPLCSENCRGVRGHEISWSDEEEPEQVKTPFSVLKELKLKKS